MMHEHIPIITSTGTRVLSEGERMAFGRRARSRREEIGLSRTLLATISGLAAPNLVNWELKIPSKRTEEEERWEKALRVPKGWIRDESLTAPGPPSLPEMPRSPCASVADEIRMVGCWLLRENPFQRTLSLDDLSESERREVKMFAMRYGVAGETLSTLNAIGEHFSLTRERVRQIVENMVRSSAGLLIELPYLNQLAERLKSLLPAPIATLDAPLQELLGESLSVEYACLFSREILGRAIAVITDRPANLQVPWAKVAMLPGREIDSEAIREVRESALAMIRSCGAAQITFVCGMASESIGRFIPRAEAISYCHLVPEFEWLLEDAGWFWYGPGRENRLINASRKILAVANRNVEAEEIQAGLARARRRAYTEDRIAQQNTMLEPPLHVVEKVLKRMPGVECIQHDDFILTEQVDLNSVLSETEMHIYECIHRNGGVAAKHTLNTEIVDTGKAKFMALQVSMDSTPILVRLDFGLYALRGYSFEDGALDKQSHLVGGSNRKYPAPALQPDGTYLYDFVLTDYAVRTSMFLIPVAVDRVLQEGEYVLDGFEDTVGYVSGTCRLRRFVSKLSSAGYRTADVVRLQINTDLMRMTLIPTESELRCEADISANGHKGNDCD